MNKISALIKIENILRKNTIFSSSSGFLFFEPNDKNIDLKEFGKRIKLIGIMVNINNHGKLFEIKLYIVVMMNPEIEKIAK